MKKVLDKLKKLWYNNQAVSKEKPPTKASQKIFKNIFKKYLTNIKKCGKIIEHSSRGQGFTE